MTNLNFPSPFDKSDPYTASLYNLPQRMSEAPWATVSLAGTTIQDNGDGTYTHTFTAPPQPLPDYTTTHATLGYQDISLLLQKLLSENAHADPDFVLMRPSTYARLHCRRRWLARSHPSHLAQSRQMARLRRIQREEKA